MKIGKLKCDLKFLLTCKKHNLWPTFARPKICVKMDKKIRTKITKTIIEAEITNKHKRIKHLKKEMAKQLIVLREKLGFVLLSALNKIINNRIKSKRQEWSRIHERKLTNLFNDITPAASKERPHNVVHNFSSYQLSAEEHHILSYGLDHHIPTSLSENEVKTEFEVFFYSLKKQLGHLTSDEKDELKSKLRRSCENYYRSSRSKDEVDEIIQKISKNKNIKILKQDKGRGVVIMDSNKYTEKCMALINTDNFRKIQGDNTKQVEESVQRALLKIKDAIGEDKYKQIYPSGSNPGKFYGTAKVHKVKPTDEDKISKLPIRPIVSILEQQLIRLLSILVTY